MKTRVEITYEDLQYKEYKRGELGYIDGYTIGGDGAPYAVVVKDDGSIVLIKPYRLRAFGFYTVEDCKVL